MATHPVCPSTPRPVDYNQRATNVKVDNLIFDKLSTQWVAGLFKDCAVLSLCSDHVGPITAVTRRCSCWYEPAEHFSPKLKYLPPQPQQQQQRQLALLLFYQSGTVRCYHGSMLLQIRERRRKFYNFSILCSRHWLTYYSGCFIPSQSHQPFVFKSPIYLNYKWPIKDWVGWPQVSLPVTQRTAIYCLLSSPGQCATLKSSIIHLQSWQA